MYVVSIIQFEFALLYVNTRKVIAEAKGTKKNIE